MCTDHPPDAEDPVTHLPLLLHGLLLRALHRAREEPERGDIPGWVLITVMTAGLVTVLWALAGEQLQELFTSALAEVDGPGGTS